jgi:hypothetical protein
VKHLQDLLGEVHDLDVLRLDLRRNSSGLDAIVVGGWQDRILAERKVRLGEVISRTSGSGSLLATWRAGFQIAHAITAGLLLNRRTA